MTADTSPDHELKDTALFTRLTLCVMDCFGEIQTKARIREKVPVEDVEILLQVLVKATMKGARIATYWHSHYQEGVRYVGTIGKKADEAKLEYERLEDLVLREVIDQVMPTLDRKS